MLSFNFSFQIKW